METVHAQIERLCFPSTKAFEEVLAGLYRGISRPNLDELKQRLEKAHDLAEFAQIVKAVVGSAGLLEFLRLDLGAALRVGSVGSYRMIRIIAGNPMIMRSMTQSVPAAGSYAPITILIYQFGGDVRVCYDTLSSLLAAYDSPEALQIAQDLDNKVVRLIESAVK
ncbi:MAG: DUF302 domain-containing protein [Terracidiphilus sp.]|jgi:uncharacterized protein (DUF302 family)